MFRLGIFGLLIFLTCACTSDIIYSEYQSLGDNEWKQDNELAFKLEMQDTIAVHNLFINLRNTKDYEYSNLFLITKMTFPDQTQILDTLEYEMTDAEGRFLGSGFSDIKENKLFYKEKVCFQQSGSYIFQVKQAMRKHNEVTGLESLKGVKDVGLSVVKIEL